MNSPSNQSNIQLCRAVEQNSCLYDRSHVNYDKRVAYENAWRDIATACGETVTTCKLRWRNIRTAFTRSVAASSKKRKGNRTRDYYLHEALEFFIPHIYTGPDETLQRESDDETDSVISRKSTTSNTNKVKKDEENTDNAEVVDEGQQIKSENTKRDNEGNLGESNGNTENVVEGTKDTDIVGKMTEVQKNSVEDTKSVTEDNADASKKVQKDYVADKKSVPKCNADDSKKVQKDYVGDKKSVPRYNADDSKKVREDNITDKKSVPKDHAVDKKSFLKDHAADTKSVPKDNADDSKKVREDNITDKKSVPKDHAVDKKSVPKDLVGGIKGDKEKVACEINNEEINKKIKNQEEMTDSTMNRSISARSRRSRKTNDDAKLEENTSRSVESRPTRKTQLITSIELDEDFADDDAANDLEESSEKAKSTNKKSQSAKSKGTFYISPRNSGTKLVIKKNNGNNDMKDTAQEHENEMEEDVSIRELAIDNNSESNKTNDLDNVDVSSDDMPLASQSRFRRACKRGLEKPTPPALRVRQKESKAKELKHSMERLKAMNKATAQLAETYKAQPKPATNVEPKENQTTLSNQKTRILCRPRAVVVDPDVILLTDTTTKGIQTRPSFSVDPLKLPTNECQPQRVESMPKPLKNMETQNVETRTHARIHQGVQCSLQPTSSDDDEFLKTLKPYLHEMNARQKLHFKKKIFESLMEVFDSESDFPTHNKSNVTNAAAVATATATAIIPKQLSTVKDEELRLVRELVAMVQAAKHTADLHCEFVAELSDTNQQAYTASSFEKYTPFTPTPIPPPFSSTSTPAIAPPPLTVRGTPLSTSTPQATKIRNPTLPSAIQINNRSMQPVSTATGTITINASAAHSISVPSITTTSANTSPSGQRRIVRKLVKVNADGQVTYSKMPTTPSTTESSSANGEILRRRIYRILPKPSTSNDQSPQHAVTTSGVGTFIVPRPTDVTANIESPRIRVGNNAPPPYMTTTAATTNKQNKKSSTITVASGARPLIRRYSVCGALPNVTIERHTATNTTNTTNKFLTTTANTREVQTAPKITISSRNSPPKVFSKDIFKLPPISTRSTISTISNITTTTTNTNNTTVTVVVTNTTTSRNTPIVSVSNSSARTVPLTMGFNKFFRGDGNTKGPVSSVAQSSYTTTSQASNSQSSTHTSKPRISISQSPHVTYPQYSNRSQSRVTVSQNANISQSSYASSFSQFPVSQRSSTSRGASSGASDVSTPSPPLPPPAFVACNPVKRSYERTSANYDEKRLCLDVEKRDTEEPLEEDMLGLGIIASDAFDVLHIKEEPEDHTFQF